MSITINQEEQRQKRINQYLQDDKKTLAQNQEEEIRKKITALFEDKKDADEDEPNFIKKDDPEKKQESEMQEASDEVAIAIKTNLIKPINNQQRNLDREVGGLEEEEQKESSEKDVWDDRSEEVDKMGSTDVFNTTGMRSVIWKQKQNRLIAKKFHDAGVDATTVKALKNGKTKVQGSSFDDMGYVEKLKHLKQDRSHENNNGRSG